MRGRGAVFSVILVSLLALAVDLSRPAASQFTARVLLTAIDVYQATAAKALVRAGARCRFTPSCSHYGEAVIRQHGALKGGWMAIKRIFRCGPWTPMGTHDPPPGTPVDGPGDMPGEVPADVPVETPASVGESLAVP